jgi:hypothetical protein
VGAALEGVNEVNLPLHFHTFPRCRPSVLEKATGLEPPRGVLHRRVRLPDEPRQHPRRRHRRRRARALSERAHRVRRERHRLDPYALDRMDFEWEDRFRDLGLTMKPSDYWRRQCKATFQFDRIGTKLIDDMGVETLMWGSTTRTPTACGRSRRKYIEEQFGHLPADVHAQDHLRERGQFYGLIK